MKRRAFLKHTIAAGAALPLFSGGLFARPLAAFPFRRAAAAADRILVLINLNGGNDGLNTLVPVHDQRYYDARTVLGIKEADTFRLSDDLGMNKVIPEIHGLYNDGKCAIVQNVGYPNQDRSHFRSTDIWHSASDADEVLVTGWTGRYMETIHPEYPDTLPNAPFAIQVSSSTTLLIQGSRASMGMAIDSPDRFYDLANGLTVVDDPVPATMAGPQLEYIRRIILEADAYSKEINRAIGLGKNYVEYQEDSLSMQLRGVARLIDGGLPTSIYVVTLNGFDTHYKQPEIHAQLLKEFSGAVKTFLDDMGAAGKADRVVCVSYSEFGRRLAENNALGTDHGAAAPQFVMGKAVLGGKLLGDSPDLGDLDNRGDIKMKIDFRQIYATILEDWLGFGHDDTVRILGGNFEKLPLFDTSALGVEEPREGAAASIRLEQNVPNPARSITRIGIHLQSRERVRLSIFGNDGRASLPPIERTLEPGTHTIPIDVSALPAGSYLYTLQAGGQTVSKRMTVVR